MLPNIIHLVKQFEIEGLFSPKMPLSQLEANVLAVYPSMEGFSWLSDWWSELVYYANQRGHTFLLGA